MSALRENAQGLVDLLMRSENSGFMVKDAEIRRKVQTLKIISQELEDKLVEIKADLRTVLEKIEVVRAKITSWITWVSMGIFLVLLWITGGQIYLLWHFWHTRSKTLSPEE